MIEIAGYSSLLMNSMLVDNLIVNPPTYTAYSSYDDMLPDILTTELADYDDYIGEDYSVEVSPEAYKLTIMEGLLPPR